MNNYSVAGLIFSNVNDECLQELTAQRSMASVPFGSRYRLIDFALSNLVNASVLNVGLIIKENYRSLLDHIGSGVFWDLDRKNGGIHLMPPFNTMVARRNKSMIEAMYGAMDFIERSHADYIVTYDSNIVANIDLSDALSLHNERNSDITVVYHKGNCTDNKVEYILDIDNDSRVVGWSKKADDNETVNRELGVIIYKSSVLCDIVKQAYLDSEYNLEKCFEGYTVHGYCHDGFAAVMNSVKGYFDANMQLLNGDVRNDLFNTERRILTKTRDDMPTRYGTHAKVSNSFVADGCVIEGTVKNCIVFRGVKVERDAVVENCILMQGTRVLGDAKLEYVVSDKNASVSAGTVIKGTDSNTFLIKKNQTI